jgi:uncharacterized protein YkwD
MQPAKTSTARVLAAVAVFLTIGMLAPVAQAGTPNYAWQLFRATNDSRDRHGVHALDRAHRMSKEAEAHSRAMARSKHLWHTQGPVRYDAHCYSWGENVGWTTGDVPDLEKAFMASAGHRQHILDRTFERVAVGAVRSNGKLWVTVFFCT